MHTTGRKVFDEPWKLLLHTQNEKAQIMRYRNVQKWDEPAKIPSLLYFAQLLDEMLFEFSLDTYKASVMQTGFLCQEALNTILEVEAGTIKPPNIFHVTAELLDNFQKDSVAIALAPFPPASFIPTLKNQNPKTPLRDLKTVLELLASHFSPRKYRAKNEELLLAATGLGGSISEVRRLTRSYVTTLAAGLSTNYICEQAKNFFHTGPGRITGPDALSDFFKLFPLENTEYSVVFRVDKIFEHVGPAFDNMKLKISSTPPPNLDLTPYPAIHAANLPGLYATIENVMARDPYSARDNAENMLQLSGTLLTLFHHKERPSWVQECVVFDTKSSSYHRILAPTNSMHKCADLQQPVASKRLQAFINDFSLERKSFSKFVRSAELHALAVGSNADENQILNLWIALESLIPSETKSDDVSNIEHIVASLIPFLNFNYLERLVNNLVKDLLAWNSPITKKALKKIPGKKFPEKLVRIFAFPEYASQRKSLEDSFKDFHLLKDRFDYFATIFSSPQNIVNMLDAHKQRLEWQIRRIYRTRNIIVHSGTTPRYTKALIEHTHGYLDTVLNLLIRLASDPKAIHSVSQGFKFVELRYAQYYNSLSAKSAMFENSNVERFVFCR